MAEPLRVYPLTVDDYHAMAEAGILEEDARVELIDGQLVEKMPIGPDHIRIVNTLTELAIRRAADRVEVSIQNPVRLGRYTEPEPDVVLLRRDRDRTRIPEPDDVLLLIEVADSSVAFDRAVKLPRYAKAGVPEVWIVNVPDACVECYHNPRENGYASSSVCRDDDRLQAQLVSELGSLSVRDLMD